MTADNAREEEIAATKAAWEAIQPGRRQRGGVRVPTLSLSLSLSLFIVLSLYLLKFFVSFTSLNSYIYIIVSNSYR